MGVNIENMRLGVCNLSEFREEVIYLYQVMRI